jgi:hypothetical protein
LTNPWGWPLQIYLHPGPFSNLLLFLEELFGNHNPIGMLTEKDETPCAPLKRGHRFTEL